MINWYHVAGCALIVLTIGITLFGAFIAASKRRVVMLSKVGLSHLKD
jgi:hypothetical protein